MARPKFSTRLIAYAALMTALVYAGTLIGFSSAQFYFNLGDCVILIAAYLLGPIPAMIAGGLGAFLGDLTVYPATMVYTLFIKAIEGLAAGLLFLLVKKLTAKYFAKRLTGEMLAFMKETSRRAELSDEQNDEASSPAQAIEKIDENASQTSEAASDIADALPNAQIAKEQVNESDIDTKTPVSQKIRAIKRRKTALECALSLPVCLFCSGLMAVGYFICQTFMYGTYAAALVALPMDAVQAAISSALATAAIGAFNLAGLKFSKNSN